MSDESTPAPARRRRRVVSQVLALLLVAVCAGAVLAGRPLTRGTDGRPVHAGAAARPVPVPPPVASGTAGAAGTVGTVEPGPLAGADAAQATALRALLAARAAAVLAADRDAWVATVDPRAPSFRARQAQVFDNLREVPFAAVDYQVASVASGPSAQRRRELAAPAVVVRVIAGYRLRGFDRAPAQVEQLVTCVQRGGRWYVTGDTDAGGVQPWDLGPVHVVVHGGVLAMGTAPRATLQQYAAVADAGVQQVTRVWGRSWPRRAVLLVPRTQAEMARLMQRGDQTGLDQVAAVTTGELAEEGGRADSDRVIVNPAAFARLTDAGRRVVLTHELTHVAVRASTAAPVPIWLSEGFADYVGYLGVDLSRATVAAQLLKLTREGRGFTALPTTADFDASRASIAPAYSASWLACTLVADRYGQDALVRLYRLAATGDGSDPDAALVQAMDTVLGATEPAFTAAWVQYVGRLARAGTGAG